MIITAHVRPSGKNNELSWIDEDTVKITVTAAPEKGKANQAVIKLLSKELSVSKSSITLLRGTTTRIKQFKIEKTG